MIALWRWLRTVRHFPVSSLWHRLRLKIKRKRYRPPQAPLALYQEWRAVFAEKTDFTWLPAGLGEWCVVQGPLWNASGNQTLSERLLAGQGELLNQPFELFQNRLELQDGLAVQTPLWREAYGYLEFLLPLLRQLSVLDLQAYTQGIELLESQCQLFWQLPFRERNWSTYGVARRLLVYRELLKSLACFSALFQQAFWEVFYQEACFLAAFLEVDIGGNHLVQDLTAWLAVTLAFEKLPVTRPLAERWWRKISGMLAPVFESQVLPDGFHYERTPMYHGWVLKNLLECIHILKAEKPDFSVQSLEALAVRMLAAGRSILHSSGQIPLLGDSSLPQAPDFSLLERYAQDVLGGLPDEHPAALTYLPDAGLAVFRLENPSASLVLDCGDFGPRCLPAHSHCDIGSFEVHVEDAPIVVDCGVSEYAPSLLRDYFRSSAAHNALWVPRADQAEICGGFRVAEYPDFQGAEAEQDAKGAKVTVRYENYSREYQHQRSVYGVAETFWVVQDWLTHLIPAGRECYSLLHIHPDCGIEYRDSVFTLAEKLLVIPFGFSKIEWADYAPWRTNLNLYSAGFSLARPGKLIAATPKPLDCFGWVLAPFTPQNRPVCQKLGDSVALCFPQSGAYRLTWDSGGLQVAFLGPGLSGAAGSEGER